MSCFITPVVIVPKLAVIADKLLVLRLVNLACKAVKTLVVILSEDISPLLILLASIVAAVSSPLILAAGTVKTPPSILAPPILPAVALI